MPIPGDVYFHIASNDTYQVASQSCILKSVMVNTGVAGTITIYDENGSATDHVVGIVTVTDGQVGTLYFNCVIERGIKVVTSTDSDITVTWTT